MGNQSQELPAVCMPCFKRVRATQSDEAYLQCAATGLEQGTCYNILTQTTFTPQLQDIHSLSYCAGNERDIDI